MKYDSSEIFSEIEAFRRASRRRKIAFTAFLAAGLAGVWAVGLADLLGLFYA